MKAFRSLLFVPGNRTDFLDKADKYGADALIVDLEDAVPEALKHEGQDIVQRYLAQRQPGGASIYVRINPLDTPHTAKDIESIVSPALEGIVLPKAQSTDDIRQIDEMLGNWERRRGLDVGQTRIIPCLETALGMVRTFEICTSSPRIETVFSAGISRDGDGNRSVGYQWTKGGMERLYLRSRILLEARAAGIEHPICGVWIDLDDPEGLRNELLFARQLGYQGYVLIYPGHVAAANEVFGVTQEEIRYANDLIAAMAEAEARGVAAIRFEGAMVDIANVAKARLTLEKAKRYQR